ncbi:hypothetical protein GMST_13850 [Geomonas silvestris]|uniref:Uncharacterized protein n=1 Tax=Geomonas silvestris TaxID=2740184 RepID=A0A6V8MGE4_9BACT|nr:hypothetical protein [Geomonas silvestris]GFO59060.1 hypothetical protein GMST_13850 [Geomonas silvestris]
MKRHKDALGIQEGAINVRAMARSLVGAAEEAASEGAGAEQDAAVRMIVHRLARVCRVDLVSYGYDPETLTDTFQLLVGECKAKAEQEAGAIGSGQAPVMLEVGNRRGSR